jgi:hypothetical protein
MSGHVSSLCVETARHTSLHKDTQMYTETRDVLGKANTHPCGKSQTEHTHVHHPDLLYRTNSEGCLP